MPGIQPNFFSGEFFEVLRRHGPDFPLTFEAGETAGPWIVGKVPDGWGVRAARLKTRPT
jgi:hypothetical protein